MRAGQSPGAERQGETMREQRAKYLVDSIDMYNLRNRNELRVAECMREILETMIYETISEKDLKDVYAYSLNQLPARYAQNGTIVLNDPVRRSAVLKVVRDAFTFVMDNPKD
ncbi:MAG: late competence development ComFB family protein [Desulfovibrio sp.]|jgi:hypothetical protein|nr:late competence development ComFB family protein [Desulfovibrio sp.]